MRGVHKFLVTVGVTVAAVGLALAQGGGGGGFGFGFGKGGNTNPVTLINREDVKKELKLTDEQLAKVPDALWKAIGEVLTPDQTKRLRQIVLQQRGAAAFTDPKVQTALKLNDDQKDAIKSAIETQTKEMKELFAGGGFGKGKGKGGGAFDKIQEIQKATMEKITGVLTARQKTQWNEMIGEEFKLQPFGGFGKGKGGFGKKKNDT
jgi:hypothetical protein